MTLDQLQKLRAERPREFDALVAEHVHGYRRGNPRRGEHAWFTPDGENTPVVSRYSTDPAADYESLKVVRETWGLKRLASSDDRIYAFHTTLAAVLRESMDRQGVTAPDEYTDLWLMLYYKPGDYSLAALAVAMQEGGQQEAGSPSCPVCNGTGTVNAYEPTGMERGVNDFENWPAPCPKCNAGAELAKDGQQK